jgi:hypothetical protein
VLLGSTTVRATRMARAENGAPKAGACDRCVALSIDQPQVLVHP